ncbi:hypothetical protein DL763_007344 [Monosporascus cannonballus]|nr:hypothetical protein DL763_007344 [Monosporascus cannonballus]
MATIEPRLIHLLNESTATPRPHHAELPPIKGLSLPPGRPHPIEPDAGRRSDGADANGGQLAAQQPRPSLYLAGGDEGSATATAGQRRENASSYAADRTLLSHISSQDLRMILDDTPDCTEDPTTKKRPSKEDFVQLPQPLKKQKSGTQQHVFPPIIVGLLEPPLNVALFPPISSGSFDDRSHSEPPQALNIAKAPEIQTGPDDKRVPSPSPDAADKTPTGKAKRRAAKPRRKWTEEETNHLLMGVSKHGVGRWTDILADKEYSFNDRSAGDLKDRFRTCCPEELRANLMAKKEGAGDKQQSMAASETRPRKGLMSENILNETEEDVVVDTTTTTTTEKASSSQSAQQQQQQRNNNDSDSAATAAGHGQQQQQQQRRQQQRKSRAHRKNMEDLAELGIRGPFKKSHRRERRPFSEQDDREILEGFELYGPQWTKIQRDPRFNLSSRQPTDLRDRLRNKYPERFAAGAGAAEKTTAAALLQAKEVPSQQQQQQTQQGEQTHHQQQQPGPHSNNLLEPSVHMVIENSLSAVKSSSAALLEPQLHRTGSREDVLRWPSLLPAAAGCGGGFAAGTEGAVPEPAGGFYWNGALAAASAAAVIGEMDISRLLLNDDEQAASEQQQQTPPSSDRRGQG